MDVIEQCMYFVTLAFEDGTGADYFVEARDEEEAADMARDNAIEEFPAAIVVWYHATLQS